jgi:hypothetical protein
MYREPLLPSLGHWWKFAALELLTFELVQG